MLDEYGFYLYILCYKGKLIFNNKIYKKLEGYHVKKDT